MTRRGNASVQTPTTNVLCDMSQKISSSRFYYTWKGHDISDVSAFRSIALSLRPGKPIIYLAGDSLDNKYWVPPSGPGGEPLLVDIPEFYRSTLEQPHPKPDIAFWLNHMMGDRATAINLAVEASTLWERDDELLEHDDIIRDNLPAQDILIVFIGGNDIALKPTFELYVICYSLPS